ARRTDADRPPGHRDPVPRRRLHRRRQRARTCLTGRRRRTRDIGHCVLPREPGDWFIRCRSLILTGEHPFPRRLQMAEAATRLKTPTDLSSNATKSVADALNGILANSFALYLKTKNFHWHVSGPHFRDYHLLLDEQAADILATTDQIAERVRKTGN